MEKKNYIVRYKGYENVIQLPAKVSSFTITHFASALNEWKTRKQYERPLTIDFSAVRSPYSNGMLAIIAMITRLKADGHKIKIRLPNDKNVSDLFVRTNWAFFLNPDFGRSKYGYNRHLHTRNLLYNNC